MRLIIQYALLILVQLTPAAAFAERVDYSGHQLVQVEVGSDDDLHLLQTISPDLWTDYPRIGQVPARIPPDRLAALQASGLRYEVVIEDLGPMTQRHLEPRRGGPWDDYMPLNDIVTFINNLAAARPDLCEVVSIGQSLEGRDIWVLHIRGGSATNRPAVFYHGLIHCREWITAPVVLYLADHLINNYDSDPDIAALVDGLDIYLAPCVNPDGYVYTWDTARLWRKNRRNNGDGTYGVDLNRNWAYEWGYNDSGSSPYTWSETYRGPSPFSEPETQVLSNFILDHPNLVAYMDYHSYSQLILWPWGYACLGGPDGSDGTVFSQLGTAMRSEIQAVHGVYYEAGPICETIYDANGGSVDWAYGVADLFAFTIELRPESSNPGFELPPSEILPTCQENLPAILHLTEWALTQARTTLTLPNGAPELLSPGVATAIDVEITSFGEELVPDSARLHYRYDGGSYEYVPLTHVGGSLYQGILPAAGCSDSPEFFISVAGETSGLVFQPPTTPGTVFAAQVGELTGLYAEDFETAIGWTATDSVDLDDGSWDRGIPVNCDRGDPPSDYDGSGQCYLTDNSSADACNSDVDGGYTWLLSPAFDLAGADGVVRFALWYTNHTGGDPNNDYFRVYVSNNDGADWELVETVGPATSSGWTQHSFAVGDFVTPTDLVRVRFEVSDLIDGSVVEAGIDAFELEQLVCVDSGNGDFNDDGDVDLDDFAGFQQCYGIEPLLSECQPGNLDGSGAVDFADFTLFSGELSGPA